jgi:hypothetical protein
VGQVLLFPRPASEPQQEQQEEAKKKEVARLEKLKRKIEAAKNLYLKLL